MYGLEGKESVDGETYEHTTQKENIRVQGQRRVRGEMYYSEERDRVGEEMCDLEGTCTT